MRDRKLSEIRRIGLFSGLRPEEVRRVARHADILDVESGYTFARRGDNAHEFVVVLKGSARARGAGDLGLAPGAWFGAVELVTDRPHSRTIRASSPMRVLVVSQRAFVPMLDDVPGLARRLFAGVAAKLTPRAQYAEVS